MLPRLHPISDDIKDAIVYLDAGCTESFQFLGAFPLLLDLGARAVCSLEKTYLDEVVSWQPNPDCSSMGRSVTVTMQSVSMAVDRYYRDCDCSLQA